jgi:hypothetical protein
MSFRGSVKTATNILVAVVAGLVDTINIWNAATLSTLYVHMHIYRICTLLNLITIPCNNMSLLLFYARIQFQNQ